MNIHGADHKTIEMLAGYARKYDQSKRVKISSGFAAIKDHTDSRLLNNEISESEYSTMMIFIFGLYEMYKDKLKIFSPEERTIGALLVIKEVIEMDSKLMPKPSCKRGCSACCFQRVEVTDGEAKLLAAKVTPEIRAKLEYQLGLEDTPDGWADSYPHGRCAFLGLSGECTVYDIRPSACRTVFSMSDPILCEVSGERKKPLSLTNLKAEAMASALLFYHPSGVMPKMVLAALAEKVTTQ